jgi:hypothetical protein
MQLSELSNTTTTTTTTTTATIRHLCLPGGGPTGYKMLGALQHLEKNDFWKIDNIETIFTTSIGAIVSVLLCLKFDWDSINDYVIKRPWHTVFKIELTQILDAYSKKGLVDKGMIEIFFKPFFVAKDIDLNITMLDFYGYSGVELHFFAFEINHSKYEDISHLSHPDLSLFLAIQMAVAVPIIFSPVCISDKCYVDGGIYCNYPIKQCIERVGEEHKDEIFGIFNNYICHDTEEEKVTTTSTIFDYLSILITKILAISKNAEEQGLIKHEMSHRVTPMNMMNIKKAILEQEERESLIRDGIESATQFLINLNQQTTQQTNHPTNKPPNKQTSR